VVSVQVHEFFKVVDTGCMTMTQKLLVSRIEADINARQGRGHPEQVMGIARADAYC
jgi:hypothetical protein